MATQPIPTHHSEPTPEDEVLQRVALAISAHVRETTGGVIPRISAELGRDVLRAVTEIVFRTAMKEGYFRLPGGYGSLQVVPLKNTMKRLPTGQVVPVANRVKLRYVEGNAIRDQLGQPRKNSYKPKYSRRSKLTERAAEIAFPAV